jgi:outer membrane murein-binding lipoprotein Lpp
MNVKNLVAAIISAAVLSGCASMNDVERMKIQNKSMEEQFVALDMRVQRLEKARQVKINQSRNEFCFANSQMFSEGSYFAGKTCTRATGSLIYQAGQPVVYPLSWK